MADRRSFWWLLTRMTHATFTAGIPRLGLWEAQHILCVKCARLCSVFFCPDKLLQILLRNTHICNGLRNGCLKRHPSGYKLYLFVFSSKLPNRGGICGTSSHERVSQLKQRASRGSVSCLRTLQLPTQLHEPIILGDI